MLRGTSCRVLLPDVARGRRPNPQTPARSRGNRAGPARGAARLIHREGFGLVRIWFPVRSAAPTDFQRALQMFNLLSAENAFRFKRLRDYAARGRIVGPRSSAVPIRWLTEPGFEPRTRTRADLLGDRQSSTLPRCMSADGTGTDCSHEPPMGHSSLKLYWYCWIGHRNPQLLPRESEGANPHRPFRYIPHVDLDSVSGRQLVQLLVSLVL